jgi:hypothetical protein
MKPIFSKNKKKEWNVRLMIERSRAIKCPTINYQLAGAKRIQQSLFEADIVEKYLGVENKEVCQKIRATFVDQYSFEVLENLLFFAGLFELFKVFKKRAKT